MIDALYTSYINKETDFSDELPKEIQELLLESIYQTKQGMVYSHKDIMAKFKEEYNIAG